MYLQRIELQGFKSFAAKTALEFPAPGRGCAISPHLSPRPGQLPRGICGTTVIVGPNGSGKSNVVDAVRWVLGEQSLKLLRGKKATDVIFAGSANRPRASMAEVSLHLNNEDKSAPIDYSEVVITRSLYQDGSSQYSLNNQEVRLFDIVMLLAKASFGQNTYSIIGQGMVDRIVNYSPQERKEFFDEATGVKQYQIKRDRSVAKLKRSRENLEQVAGLLGELGPHLVSLSRQVNRLRRRQEVEVELRQLAVRYYGKLWLDLDADYQKFATVFTQQDKIKIRLENDINERQSQLDELGQEQSRGEHFNRLQADYDRQISQRNQLFQQLAEIRGKLDVEYLKIGKQDLTWLENRQSDLSAQIKELAIKSAGSEKQMARYQELVVGKEGEQEKMLGEFATLEKRLLELQKEFRTELGVSDSEIRQVASRLYALQKNFISKLKTTHDLDALSALKMEAELIFTEVDAFYQRLTSENKRGASEEMAELQQKLSDFLRHKDLLVNEINDWRIKREVAASEQKSLSVKLAELNFELQKVEGELKKNRLAPRDQSEITSQLQTEKLSAEKSLVEVESNVAKIKNDLDAFNEAEEEKKQHILSLQQEIHQRQTELNGAVSRLNEVKVELAKIETKKEDVFASMRQDLGADYRPKIDHDLRQVDQSELASKILKLKKQLELIGGTDPEVEREYTEVKTRHDFLSQQSEDLERAIKDLEKIVVELDKMIKQQFELEFKKINTDFSRFFKKLFEGGNAKLLLAKKELTEAEVARQELVEKGTELTAETASEDLPVESPTEIKHIEDRSGLVDLGIDIEACPPGKKIKSISVLSGGEKTMTALALICAIINNNPSPFILFDEVDAALDESNSAKFGDIIGELAHRTQFIVITHNRAIMARGDVLYGVTMQGDGVSRLIGLKLNEAQKLGK